MSEPKPSLLTALLTPLLYVGRRRKWLLPLTIVIVFFALAAAAPFVAPYPPNLQFREFPNQAPARLRLSWTLRPYLKGESSPERVPIEFLVESPPYRWLGTTWRTRLFGAGNPDKKVFLLGSDPLGRDLLSRILHGSRASLTIGIVGVLLSALWGVIWGAIAGYVEGWIDIILMRLADLVFSLPGLFLIMGLRALFPIDQGTLAAYWMIVLVLALTGWASFARIIRGQVLSLKTRDFVLWSRACGASHWWVLTRHILPFTLNTILVQSMVLIPLFILGEITLSFLGVGIQPPHPSWGNLLSDASKVANLIQRPWMLFPVVPLFVTVLSFNLLADQFKGVDRAQRII